MLIAQNEKDNAAKKKRAANARKRRLSIPGKNDPKVDNDAKEKNPNSPNPGKKPTPNTGASASPRKATPPIIRTLLQT